MRRFAETSRTRAAAQARARARPGDAKQKRREPVRSRRSAANGSAELQRQLEEPKAAPASNGHAQGHYRLRYDRLDTKGKMSLRRAGRMHHLGIGTAHARKRVLTFADDHRITVIDLHTGEVLSTHKIQPDKTYWRNQNKEPGRWPSSPK